MLIKRINKKIKSRHRNKASDGKRNLVGTRVRELRRLVKPKLTQEDLAGRVAGYGLTLDRTAIFRIENGTRSVSDIEVRVLAKALHVAVQELFSKS